MGKGYNNYMCKKPFHPGSKANIKRAWMAEQKTENDKRKQEELKAQYEKEQNLYNNRALISSESKDKLELNFMYEAPPGAKREHQKEDDEPEFKFEWQRKYNAPREDYAKNNEDIKDQPFGIPVRNVRCIKCHKWGHINTDKECPLYNQASASSMPTTSMDPLELMRQMKEDGYGLKENVLGHQLNPAAANQQFIPSEESDPEMDFLKSLSSADKKKLLKKLKKLSKKQEKSSNCKKKKSKKTKKSKRASSSSDSEQEKKHKKKKSKKCSSSDSDSSSDESEKIVKKKKSEKEKKFKKKKSKKSSSSDSDSSSEESEKTHTKKREHIESIDKSKKSEEKRSEEHTASKESSSKNQYRTSVSYSEEMREKNKSNSDHHSSKDDSHERTKCEQKTDSSLSYKNEKSVRKSKMSHSSNDSSEEGKFSLPVQNDFLEMKHETISEGNLERSNFKKIKYDHPDGFSHHRPQALVKANYLQPSEEYKGKIHDKFRHYYRDERSPSIKQKYNK